MNMVKRTHRRANVMGLINATKGKVKQHHLFMSEVKKKKKSKLHQTVQHQIRDCYRKLCVPCVSEALDSCWDASAWSGADGSGWNSRTEHVSSEGEEEEGISDGEGPAEAAGLVHAAPPWSWRSLAQNLHRKRVSMRPAWPLRCRGAEPASLLQGRGAQQGRPEETGNNARFKRRARQTGQRREPKLLRQQLRVLRDPRRRLHALRPGCLLPARSGFHPQGAQVPGR